MQLEIVATIIGFPIGPKGFLLLLKADCGSGKNQKKLPEIRFNELHFSAKTKFWGSFKVILF